MSQADVSSQSTGLPRHIDFLKKTLLSSVINSKPLYHRQLHILSPTSTVNDALQLFSIHKIKEAPIVDPSRSGRSRYLGVLSLFDLLIPLTSDPVILQLPSIPPDQAASYLSSHPPLIYRRPVLPYLGSSSESSYRYHYMSNQPLAEVMEVLSHGVHRVLVFDHDDQPQMLTQMDLVRFLVSHLNELGPVVHKSLVQLALASEDAVFEHFHKGAKERNIDHAYENIPSSSSISSSIPAPTPPAPPPPVQRRPSITERLRYLTPSSTALAGFQSMHPPYAASSQTGDVTALPIVNPANFSLLSTLSASDLRPVTMERAHLLALPVMDFLRELWLLKGKEVSKEGEVRKDREEEQRVPYIFQVVSKGDASLGRVMREMVEDEVHRSWVVDELGRVVGVVTLSDVIGKLSPFDKERGTVGIGGREEKWQDGERKGQ